MHTVHAGTGELRRDVNDPTGRLVGRINVVGFVYDMVGHIEGDMDGPVIKMRVTYTSPRPALEQDNQR